jgi:hypothetical protein
MDPVIVGDPPAQLDAEDVELIGGEGRRVVDHDSDARLVAWWLAIRIV